MSLIIFNFTVALLAMHYLVLTLYTIKQRRRVKIRLGHGEDKLLESAQRAQANFCESTPIALIILFLLMYQEINPWMLLILCGMLVVGRISHSYGIIVMEHQTPMSLKGRILGMKLTFGCIFVSVLTLLFLMLWNWFSV